MNAPMPRWPERAGHGLAWAASLLALHLTLQLAGARLGKGAYTPVLGPLLGLYGSLALIPVLVVWTCARLYPDWKKTLIFLALQGLSVFPAAFGWLILIHWATNCGGGHCGAPNFDLFDPSLIPTFALAGFWIGAYWRRPDSTPR